MCRSGRIELGRRTSCHWLLAFAAVLTAGCSSGDILAPAPARQLGHAEPTQVTPETASSQGDQQRFESFRAGVQARLARSSADLQRQHPRANVTVMPLQRRYGHAVAAKRGADGRLSYGCFADADQTAAFITEGQPEAQQ